LFAMRSYSLFIIV